VFAPVDALGATQNSGARPSGQAGSSWRASEGNNNRPWATANRLNQVLGPSSSWPGSGFDACGTSAAHPMGPCCSKTKPQEGSPHAPCSKNAPIRKSPSPAHHAHPKSGKNWGPMAFSPEPQCRRGPTGPSAGGATPWWSRLRRHRPGPAGLNLWPPAPRPPDAPGPASPVRVGGPGPRTTRHQGRLRQRGRSTD